MLLSPSSIRFATVFLIAGVMIFAAFGLAGRGDTVTVLDSILAAVVWGGPISAVLGVITGLVWEKLISRYFVKSTMEHSKNPIIRRGVQPPRHRMALETKHRRRRSRKRR